MKNKVLRLAIIAVLVVAMVLSMAACVDPVPPVDPSPSASPAVSPSAPVVTKTPDKTPEVGSDEALLESKYGITFPVADGMKFDYVNAVVPDPSATPSVSPIPARGRVLDVDGNEVTFGAQAPLYNDAFNAYKDGITVTAKVVGLTKEGGKIKSTQEVVPGAATGYSAQTYAPDVAGTFTVTYTVKVSYDAGENIFGFFKPAKINETYSVVKTYEVAKKKVTIESSSDIAAKSNKLNFTASIPYFGSAISAEEKEKIEAELLLVGDGKKYDLSVNVLNVDTTAYGTYPLTLTCVVKEKTDVVDIATLVAPNYEVTFKSGNRYVLTDAELAAATAAADDAVNAIKKAANKEDVALGVATYTALSAGAKVRFDTANHTLIEAIDGAAKLPGKTIYGIMMVNQENLSKVGMVEEALKLAKVWNDKLQNAEDLKAFIGYMVSLNTDENVSLVTGPGADSDYKYVTNQLREAAIKTGYLTTALDNVDEYKEKLVTDFIAANDAFKVAVFTDLTKPAFGKTINKSNIDTMVKELAKLQTKFDALLKDQKSDKVDSAVSTSFKLKEVMAKADKFVAEVVARYEAYATLIADLDAYTDTTKATLKGMTSLLGYDFDVDVKAINNDDAEVNSAAKVFFGNTNVATDKYIVFTTPMTFIADATKAFKTRVDAYVALDAAIVEAQVTLMSTLGSKLALAGDSVLVESFDLATKTFENGTSANNKLMKYEAMQVELGRLILEQVYTKRVPEGQNPAVEAIHFETLGKKELAEVIATALKTPVSEMNSFIKEWDGEELTPNP